MSYRVVLVKICAFILPFVCFIGFFLANDPFDYFGFHRDMRGFSEPNPVPRIRFFLNNESKTSVILGDII